MEAMAPRAANPWLARRWRASARAPPRRHCRRGRRDAHSRRYPGTGHAADRARRAAYSGHTSRRAFPEASGRPLRRLPQPKGREPRRAHRQGRDPGEARAARQFSSSATMRIAFLIFATTASGFPEAGCSRRAPELRLRNASSFRHRRRRRSVGRRGRDEAEDAGGRPPLRVRRSYAHGHSTPP